MNILFVTEDMHQGSSLMRAYWPSMWINKFTEHRSYCIDARQAASQQAMFMIDDSDIVVCHKHHDAIMGAARYAKEQGKKLVFETDDFDEGGFDNFYNGYYLLGFFENLREMVSIADGVTCGSQALAERTDHPSAIAIENGFDFYLNCYSVKPKAYFENDREKRYKIAWGGGTSHGRDFVWLFKSGIIERLMEKYPIDLYIYGLEKWIDHQRNIGKGRIFTRRAVGVEQYINRLFADADFLIAPLVQDDFNGCRSTLKLVEAGAAGKTIIASNVESYRAYKGVDNVTLLDNNPEAWYDAIVSHIKAPVRTARKGIENQKAVYKYYNAYELTQQRIKYFEEL